MVTKELLSKKLDLQESWIHLVDTMMPIFKSYFIKKNAKSDFLLYKKAKERIIANNIILRTDTYDDCFYTINVFSTTGDLEALEITLIQKSVDEIDLETIRYESFGTQGIFPLSKADGFPISDDYIIYTLGSDIKGAVVYCMASFKKEELDVPYVVYIKNSDGSTCRSVISNDILKKLEL